MSIQEKTLREVAERCDFSVRPATGCGRGAKRYYLTANWEYSDGYKPSTIALTAREAHCYLCGFIAARYEH